MKQKLYSILPKFITTLKHGDKIAHAIYGTLFYLILTLILGPHISLFLTWVLAAGVEIYDMRTHKGDMLDFLSTTILPTLIYLLTNH
jgi:hypothetical protein